MLAPEAPIEDWLADLDALARRSPAFFAGRAVILDVTALAPSRDALKDLVTALTEREIPIMGIEGAGPGSLGPGMPPPLNGGRPSGEVAMPGEAPAAAPVERVTGAKSLMLESPVRSGQAILFPEGDVTVMGSVASGAEVIAGGSIHIYGALRGGPSRGRRLAGRAYLLPQVRARTARHRRPLPHRRRHRPHLARPRRPGLARRRHDAHRRARLTLVVLRHRPGGPAATIRGRGELQENTRSGRAGRDFSDRMVQGGSMAKVIVVTSGKGGVGKTTTTAALGAALAKTGQSVCVVDFDVGLRNLDLIMGAERRVVYDLINVVQGDAKLPQALIRDKRIDTLSLLPASQTRDKDALTDEGVARVIGELREKFDWVICDSPAGIERGATLAMRHADIAVVVTNPEVSSVRDSDRIIGLLDSKTERAEKGERLEKHLILTRYDPNRAERGEMLKIDDVLEILSIPLLAVIPESEEVLKASNLGSPVTLNAPQSAPARAYADAVRRLKGETVAMTVPSDKRSLFGKLFTRRAA